MSDPVLFETVDGVAVITLNRPEARNAMNAAMTVALRTAIDRVEEDGAIRLAVLCANGPAFCAGMDLKAFAAGEGDAILEGPGGFGGLVRRARQKPLVAAVGGPALAGGFELALACDMIVAAPGAGFGLPEPRRGLIAGAGGVFRLAARIPMARAAEILLTGRMVARDEAVALGLVSRTTENTDPRAAALTLAKEIAACAPLSVAATLRLMRAAQSAAEPALWEENDRLFGPIATSADALEGATAFAQKHPARWEGK